MQTKMPPPPKVPREWKLSYHWPDAVKPGTPTVNQDLDAHFQALPWPVGWTVVGVIPCSRPGATCAPDWTGWFVRVTLWPDEWVRETVYHAPVAVYAAAQMAGLGTQHDRWLSADWNGIQFHLPDGSPIMRQCFWEQREELPEEIVRALEVMQYVDGRRGRYMWARPDHPRAHAQAEREAEADRERADKARIQVVEWIRSTWPKILR